MPFVSVFALAGVIFPAVVVNQRASRQGIALRVGDDSHDRDGAAAGGHRRRTRRHHDPANGSCADDRLTGFALMFPELAVTTAVPEAGTGGEHGRRLASAIGEHFRGLDGAQCRRKRDRGTDLRLAGAGTQLGGQHRAAVDGNGLSRGGERQR